MIDDFGMSPLETLANAGLAKRATCHAGFWTTWNEDVRETPLVLRGVKSGDIDASDPTGTHVLEGQRHTRLGCFLIEPEAPVRGGIVVLHGYGAGEPLESQAEPYRHLAERGTGVLLVRARGFPGSRKDCGDLTSSDAGWICQGMQSIECSTSARTDWVLSLAVADVVCAVRAFRALLSTRVDRPRMALSGESFGAGLAVIAAAQLGGELDRLCIGLPTFGDWYWRLGEDRSRAGVPGSSGGQVAAVMPSDPKQRDAALRTLELFDAVVHARHVRCPVLCKLAARDEVVPAPTQAAVYNALGSGPGEKWRFVVPAGHADAGIANTRRHALFERARVEFLDLSRTPERAMERWEPLLTGGERPEDLRSTGGLFGDGGSPGELDQRLGEAYAEIGRTLDDLPYTREFDRLFETVREIRGAMDRRDLFHRLHNLRKAGKLPRVGRSGSKAQAVTPEREAELRELVIELAGSLGQRDRLPYTPEFDRLVSEFNNAGALSLEPYDVWRLVAKLAK